MAYQVTRSFVDRACLERVWKAIAAIPESREITSQFKDYGMIFRKRSHREALIVQAMFTDFSLAQTRKLVSVLAEAAVIDMFKTDHAFPPPVFGCLQTQLEFVKE
ncbi:hypothetical protein TNCV_5134141 [Trichonephila clavipes]|nr:hypothetical protein TNCV_5134141 [Trichonephila clavipes]